MTAGVWKSDQAGPTVRAERRARELRLPAHDAERRHEQSPELPANRSCYGGHRRRGGQRDAMPDESATSGVTSQCRLAKIERVKRAQIGRPSVEPGSSRAARR